MKTTNRHLKYWKERKIDWEKSYLTGIDPETNQPMWNHPHRSFLVAVLKNIPFISLWEVGCGAGANLVKFVKELPNKQYGGSDPSPDAIAVAQRTLTNGLFHVESGENMLMSDNSVDVILSDACLIYVSPLKIRKYIREMKRIARNHIVLCEFHSHSWLDRWLFRLKRGYNAYNYRKLLESEGFYNIQLYKIPPEFWPGEPWRTWGYVITAKKPKNA